MLRLLTFGKRNSLRYCIDSNQIVLIDEDQSTQGRPYPKSHDATVPFQSFTHPPFLKQKGKLCPPPNFLILSPRISVTHFASPGCLWTDAPESTNRGLRAGGAGAKSALYDCLVGVLWQHLDFWNEPSSFSETIFLRVSPEQSERVEKLLTGAGIPHDVVVSDLHKSVYPHLLSLPPLYVNDVIVRLD